MKYQITRHIEAQVDPQDRDKVLLENLFYRSRMLSDDEIWPVLQRFEQPATLGDSKLEARAVQAKLIVPLKSSDEVDPLTQLFEEISGKVLRYRKFEADAQLTTRLLQLAQACHPISSIRYSDYFIWHDPSLVFKVMLDHFDAYLTTEFGSRATSDLSVSFLKDSLGRPPRQESLEQQVCTLDTSWRRAEKISSVSPQGAKILVLGDDDLVSLALTQFRSEQLDVLELDSKLVRLLKTRGGSKLKVYRRDLACGLPEEFMGRFDVVVSDPMYSKDGMTMFLDCCVNALKPSPQSRLFLTTYPPLLEDPQGFFDLLKEKGLKLHTETENFSRYPFPKDMRSGALDGLKALGYHPKLSEVLLDVPYLYAHLYECGLSQAK